MSRNEDLCNLNRWARCWYTFQMENAGRGDALRNGDTIKIAFQAFDGNACAQVNAGFLRVIRIPSHLSTTVQKALGKSYNMTDLTFECDNLEQVEFDMNLRSREWNEVVMGHALKRSDLYVIDYMFVEPQFRSRGLASHMLRVLPKLLRLNMHERKPVIVTVPYQDDAGTDMKRLIALFEKSGFTFPQGSAHTMIYNLE